MMEIWGNCCILHCVLTSFPTHPCPYILWLSLRMEILRLFLKVTGGHAEIG